MLPKNQTKGTRMSPRILSNLQQVARGGWNLLDKEDQTELTRGNLVHIDEYTDPVTITITNAGNQALKEKS